MEVAGELYKPGAEGLLAPLNTWFNDDSVSEILINRPHEVVVERHGVFEHHPLNALTPMHLKRLFYFIANDNQQALDEAHPLLSGSLKDGSRVQLVIPPAAKHYTLAVRRNTIAHKPLKAYQSEGFFNAVRPFFMHQADKERAAREDELLLKYYHQGKWDAFLTQAVAFKKNILISGETSSGKTSLLNSLLAEIPLNERLITLEDTYELKPPHANCVNLLAPKKSRDAEGGLCMQDLVQCAMRLRPDRLFMGEIRGAEVLDFINACASGHEGSLSTIHAGSPRLAMMRMVQLYKHNNVPSMRDADILRELDAVIDIIVQVAREGNVRQAESIYFKATEDAPWY